MGKMGEGGDLEGYGGHVMSLMKRWRRWSARLLRVGCLASAVGVSVLGVSALVPGTARSQEGGPGDKTPSRHFTKITSFHLPIQLSPAQRADIREFCLYVKQAGGDWVRVETAPPTANYFSPKVTRDGEYWFSLVTVSKAGKQMPPDVTKAEPSLRVIVDTNPPVLDVQPTATPEREFCLKCSVIDANYDPTSLRAVSRTDKGELPLDPVLGSPGTFRIRDSELAFPVRVTAMDLAKNVATRDVNIGELVRATMRAEEKVSTVSHKVTGSPLPVGPGPLAAPSGGLPPGLVEVPPTGTPLPGTPMPVIKKEVPGGDLTPGSPFPAILPGTSPALSSGPPMPSYPLPVVSAPGTPGPGPKGLVEISPSMAVRPEFPGSPAPPIEGKGGAPRQLLNTPRVSIDYRIDHVGASGVGKVDVYLTTDTGQNWKKVWEDVDRRSPVEVDLPGEGLFGLKLVITNGNGFGGTPPVRGEQPTCWVEVDSTSPHITLNPIEPISQNGFLEIRWAAGDANLGAEPINLYFRTRADGPWQSIATRLKNDGVHRWAFPRDMGAQFWIKAEVVDQAGNVSRAETGPVILDMNEPRASVLGISSISVRPTPPLGH